MGGRRKRKDQKRGSFGVRGYQSIRLRSEVEVGGGADLGKQEPKGIGPSGQQGEKKRKIIIKGQ